MYEHQKRVIDAVMRGESISHKLVGRKGGPYPPRRRPRDLLPVTKEIVKMVEEFEKTEKDSE